MKHQNIKYYLGFTALLTLVLVFVISLPHFSMAKDSLKMELVPTLENTSFNINISEPEDSRLGIEENILTMTFGLRLSPNIRYIGPKGPNIFGGINVRLIENKLSILAISLDNVTIFQGNGINLKFKVIDQGDIEIVPTGTSITLNDSDPIAFSPSVLSIDGALFSPEPKEIQVLTSKVEREDSEEENINNEVPEPESEPQVLTRSVGRDIRGRSTTTTRSPVSLQSKKNLPESGMPIWILLVIAVISPLISRKLSKVYAKKK